MNIFDSIILGIVEGITEFLPISSTGHLILASKLLNLSQSDFLKTFEISIQIGAIASIIFLYFKKFFLDWEMLKKTAIAFIPTAVLGLLFYKTMKGLMNESVVLWALFLGGILIVIFELMYKEKPGEDEIKNISYKNSFLIGIFQAIAMIPGVSRAGATIIGGLMLGLKRKAIVEFSFLLAVPTMLLATLYDFYKNAGSFSGSQFNILFWGFITSFVVAIFAVKFLLKFIQRNNFVAFGIYRIILALLFWIIIR